MKNWERKTGKTFLDRLEQVVLEVGRDTFTRRQMVDSLHCGNFTAASRLDWAVEKFDPKSVRDLARRIKLDDLISIKGVGVTTVYVWMCVLDWADIDPEEWLDSEVKLPTSYNKRRRTRRRRT